MRDQNRAYPIFVKSVEAATVWAVLFVIGGAIGAANVGVAFPAPDSEQAGPLRRYEDNEYRFHLTVPAGWIASPAKKPDAFRRVSLNAPDSTAEVVVYALKASGDVDVRKLANLETKLTFLGSRRTGKDLTPIPWGIEPWGIERTYADSSDGMHALVRFIVDGTFGYIVVVRSRTMDQRAMREIVGTFESDASMVANWSNWWSGVRERGILKSIGGWIGLTVAGILIGTILYILGRTGALVRTGVETLRKLHSVKRTMAAKRAVPGPQYLRVRKAAIHRIVWPLLGWSAVYALLWVFVPVEVFVVALIGLVVPSLGFYGIFFAPFGDEGIEVPIDFS